MIGPKEENFGACDADLKKAVKPISRSGLISEAFKKNKFLLLGWTLLVLAFFFQLISVLIGR
jgi:hypothetical protein